MGAGRVWSPVRACALAVSLAALALAAPPAAAEPPPPRWWDGVLTLSTGFDVSSGDYGDPVDTTIWYVPVSASYLLDDFPLTRYERDRIELKVTVPWLRIEGPGDFFVDSAGRVGLEETREDGLGDVVLRGTYVWFPPSDWPLPVVELSGKVKLPTADEGHGLGTGRTDYSLQVDVARRFGSWTPFASAGYRFLGRPRGTRLRDSPFGSLGVGYRFGRRLSAGLLYSWRGAATPERHDSHEVIPYLTVQLRDDVSLGPYAVAGLSGHTPDWALGLSIRWRIPFR